jgi:hypothetical protein
VVEQIAGWYLDLLDKRMIMRLHVEAVEELAKALKRGPIVSLPLPVFNIADGPPPRSGRFRAMV